MAGPRKYPPELLDRGARVVIESGRPIAHVRVIWAFRPRRCAAHVRRVEADEGLRPDLPTSAEREEIKALGKEVYELRRANEILTAASVFSRPSSTQTDRSERFIDEHRGCSGVEPICPVLGVSASAYYQRANGERSKRAVADERLLGRIRELHADNYYAYGYRRMWKALLRAGEQVPLSRVRYGPHRRLEHSA